VHIAHSLVRVTLLPPLPFYPLPTHFFAVLVFIFLNAPPVIMSSSVTWDTQTWDALQGEGDAACGGNGDFNGTSCNCYTGWCAPNCTQATNICGTCSPDCTILRGIGVTLAVVGNAVIALSFNLQKKAHLENEKRKEKGQAPLPFVKLPVWWMGIILMATGELGNFMAYGWAPATMVAPLGAVNIVVNAFISRVWLKQTIPRRAILGMFLAILGSVDIALTAPEADDGNITLPALANDMKSPVFIVWGCFLLIGAIVFVSMPKRFKRRYVLVYIMFCTHISSFVIISIKGVSTALQILISGNQESIGVTWSYWLTYVLLFTMIGTLLIQIRFLNKAMEHFSTAEVVPVFFVTFNIYSIATGMILFNETTFQLAGQDTSLGVGIPLFTLGILTTFVGVFLIAWKKVQHNVHLNKDGGDEEDIGVEIPSEHTKLIAGEEEGDAIAVERYGEGSEGKGSETGEGSEGGGAGKGRVRLAMDASMGSQGSVSASPKRTSKRGSVGSVGSLATKSDISDDELVLDVPRVARTRSQRFANSLVFGP